MNSIRQFYHFLREEVGLAIANPVRRNHTLKMARPLPRHLRDEQVEILFAQVKGRRDRAMFMLMLRCGLRVEEVAHLTFKVIHMNRRRILIEDGKGGKDRVVYLSNDALEALVAYLCVRPSAPAGGETCYHHRSSKANLFFLFCIALKLTLPSVPGATGALL